MPYPKTAVTIPASLGGQSNGKLPDSLLVVVGFPGRPNGRLHRQACRAWVALADALFERYGLIATVTSNADGYRSYPVQEVTFRSRYTTEVLTGRPFKIWNGVRWYQKPGTAMAAVPGTSNHGWGLAVDACWWINGATVGITAQPAAFRWLLDNADDYGFSWEVDSEPWHLRYFAGDNTPQAVLDYENPPAPIPELPEDDDMAKPMLLLRGPSGQMYATDRERVAYRVDDGDMGAYLRDEREFLCRPDKTPWPCTAQEESWLARMAS